MITNGFDLSPCSEPWLHLSDGRHEKVFIQLCGVLRVSNLTDVACAWGV